MAIDPTASEFYFRSSIKKHFIDSLTTIEKLLVVFDQTILYETVRNYSVSKWVVINFGAFNRNFISKNILEINCCTRKDPEGIELSKLTDIVVGYLTDTTMTDTMKRIKLYNATNALPANWTEVGTMLVTEMLEGGQKMSPDDTKVKTISAILSWGSII